MNPIRSNLLDAYTMATEVKKIDLPVNPLSHLILSIDGYNATDEATLAEIIAFINKIEVTHRGSTIWSVESEDLVGITTRLFGAMPILTQNAAADNTARLIGLIIPFGRKLYDPNECFPATKKGELTLTLNTTVPATSFDNAQINLEAVELPGASPQRHIKSIMRTISAPGATGNNDIDLPIGNNIAFLNLRLTTFPTTSSHDYGVNGIKILVNNKEEWYSYAKTHCLLADMQYHLHSLPRDIAAFGDILPANTVWVDFDPNGDGSMVLKTAGASSVKIRLNMGVDEATYMTVVELVEISGGNL